jgi:hypothetical protein
MATRGTVGAPSSNTDYFNALLGTTLMAYKKQMYDNIFRDSALLSYLRMSDAVTTQNGGERVAVPLMYEKNKTVKVHSGYETIDTTPQDGMTQAFYEWAEIAGSITISRKEERQNSGEGRLLNLLEQKIKQAEMSMREELNEGLILGLVSGATFVPKQSLGGANGLNPINWFIRKAPATDPIAGGNVGNISGASYSWWRPMVADASNAAIPTGGQFGLSITTYKGLVVALKRLYNYCSRGSGGSPDLVLFDQVSYETYENALDDKVRYANTKMADMGFDNIKLRGATCIWDEKTPDLKTGTEAITAGTANFINTNFFKLIIDSETDIVTTPFVEPENQTAKTAKILFMGQSACYNLRKLGALWGIAQNIVA